MLCVCVQGKGGREQEGHLKVKLVETLNWRDTAAFDFSIGSPVIESSSVRRSGCLRVG